jgi:hypothetical protein
MSLALRINASFVTLYTKKTERYLPICPDHSYCLVAVKVPLESVRQGSPEDGLMQPSGSNPPEICSGCVEISICIVAWYRKVMLPLAIRIAPYFL